jgi:hypothetical protein
MFTSRNSAETPASWERRVVSPWTIATAALSRGRRTAGIYFSSNRNGKYEIFRQGLNERVPERIVASDADDTGAQLSPDGSWILYSETTPAGSPHPSLLRLMRQPVVGGSAETILEFPSSADINYSCSRKTGNPCVLSPREEENLVFYLLGPVRGKGESLGRIEIDPVYVYQWQVSPNGSRIALVDRSHKDRIEILNLSDRTWH